MTGATAISISSYANAQAAAALSKAQDAACRAEMPGFEHNTATVQEMQGYAQCVQRLHPVDTGSIQAVAWVVLVCLVLAAIATGIQRYRSWCGWDAVGYVMIFLMWAFGLALAAVVVSGLAYLFTFL